ncbi:MAG: hypothetical protein EOO53_14420 [Gammaproteobacteria bacterium]|nr:MAG: hypothetical protein EOO53_14420 [Gammaproteobacteria bacterium]
MLHKFQLSTLATLFCLSLAFEANAQQPPAPPSPQNNATEILITGQQNASKWFRAESQHFIVFADTRREDVTQLLSNLERLDYLLRTYMKINKEAEQKLTLYYQDSANGLKEVAKDQPPFAIGLYNSCESGVQGFGIHLKRIATLTDEQLTKPLNESLSYIFEAYTRHFIYRYTNIRTPTSFIDGFAQYFASTRFSDTQMLIGKAPTSVDNYLGFISAGHTYSLDYTDILEQNDSKGHNFAGTAGVQLEFEAKSWLLTHYMLSSNENLKSLRDYLNLINQDVKPTEAFEQAFGYKASKIGNTLWKYKLKSAKALQFEFSSLPVADINFSDLPLSANNLLLADAALKACPDRKRGEAILQQVSKEAKKFPASDYAQLILSRAQIDWGNAQDALPYLTEKTQKDISSFDAFYLLGSSQLQLAQRSESAQKQAYIEASQRNFSQALTLNGQSPEAAYGLFKAGIIAENTPSEKTLAYAFAAWKNANEVTTFTKAAALAYAYSTQVTKFQDTLALLSRNIRDPQTAAWAKTWQAKLDVGVKRSEILAEMRSELSNPFKEWTIANETVMKEVELNSGLDAARSVINDQNQTQQMPSQNVGGNRGNP